MMQGEKQQNEEDFYINNNQYNLLNSNEAAGEISQSRLERKYYSCTIPNVKISMIEDQSRSHIKSIKDTSLLQANDIKRKIVSCLIIIAIILFILYSYIIYQPTNDKSNIGNHKSQPQTDCLGQFRINNCNLQNPSGDLCIQLHKCIAKSNNASTNIMSGIIPELQGKSQENINYKIANIQEFVENILLLLGGMGFSAFFTSILRKINRALRWSDKILKLFKYKTEIAKNLPAE